MKIVISNYDSGEIYEEIDNATSSQISAYSNSNVIVIDEEEFTVESIVTDHNRQILSVMVSNEE